VFTNKLPKYQFSQQQQQQQQQQQCRKRVKTLFNIF
jgi:hypothetical protein